MQTYINHSEIVDDMVSQVKKGDHTTQSATERLRELDVHVGRGTHRRLLNAEAHAILAANHCHIAG